MYAASTHYRVDQITEARRSQDGIEAGVGKGKIQDSPSRRWYIQSSCSDGYPANLLKPRDEQGPESGGPCSSYSRLHGELRRCEVEVPTDR